LSLVHRSARAAAWELASVTTQALLQFTVMAILARLIPPKEFGLYAITSVALGLLTMLSEVGVGPAVIQRREITDGFVSNAFTLSLVLGVLGAVVMWTGSPLVASFFQEPGVTGLLRAASITLIVSGYVTVATALLERELQYRILAVINATSYAIGFGLIGCSLALMGVGAWAIVGGTVSQTLVRALMLRLMGKETVKFAFSRRDSGDLLHFGAAISIARVFNYLASQIDQVAVGRLIGPAALGLYQMAFQIMDLPRRFLGSVIDRVAFATMSRIQHDRQRLHAGYLQGLELGNVVLLPVTVFLIIAAPEVVGALLGDRWTGAILPLQIMLIQVPFRASVRMTDQLGGAVGKVHLIARAKALYAAMVGIAVLVGVRWGLTGIAMTVTVAVIGNWVVMVRFALRIVEASVREYLSTWIPGGLVSSVVIAATLLAAGAVHRLVGPEILQLGAMAIMPILAVLALARLWPQVMGETTIGLILDLAPQASIWVAGLTRHKSQSPENLSPSRATSVQNVSWAVSASESQDVTALDFYMRRRPRPGTSSTTSAKESQEAAAFGLDRQRGPREGTSSTASVEERQDGTDVCR
jgi:O-antigen/teichoic acid export membrane protein